MREKKQRLRVRSFLRHESFSGSELSRWGWLIQQKVLEFSPYLAARTVVLYSPIGREVATEVIRDHALRVGKKLFYPKLGDQKHLHWVHVSSAEELRPGGCGILEPMGDRILTREDQQRSVVFVPGLAFDFQGNRLGRGWGWYDRALSLLEQGASFVALAYEFQMVEKLPAEAWDRKMHHIITEKRIIDCGDGASPAGWVP
ncbi:MAG: 5-formyltetrahydrofolate cyclo-ligase [Deltaproteobacteria bacterium]|nr:5-formyltetrahydrofolate cyclo-ligase [Deltaproteobacteria bacterium]